MNLLKIYELSIYAAFISIYGLKYGIKVTM